MLFGTRKKLIVNDSHSLQRTILKQRFRHTRQQKQQDHPLLEEFVGPLEGSCHRVPKRRLIPSYRRRENNAFICDQGRSLGIVTRNKRKEAFQAHGISSIFRV
jgi:hypothetical protein